MNQREFLATKEDLNVAVANLRTELLTTIANAQANLIKWMFLFWVGQIGVTLTLLLSLR